MIETTDDQNELFDSITEDDRVIGQITRAEAHADKSLIHRAVGAYVFDGQGRLLLQQRSLTKDTSPGAWALSVGGHVAAGDTPERAIAREVEEELGREVAVESVFKKLLRMPMETELWYTFAGVDDGPWPEICAEEIMQVKYVTRVELRQMMTDDEVVCSPAIEEVLNNWDLAWEVAKSNITTI